VRVVRILSAVLILFLVLVQSTFPDELNWVMPTEDINGNYIAPENLYANLYWGYNGDDWNPAGRMPDPPISLDDVAPGCYYLALTAVRTDTEVALESVGSNAFYYCTDTELSPNPPINVGPD
jgi:hypothetical protein